jgi:hypothetical protein
LRKETFEKGKTCEEDLTKELLCPSNTFPKKPFIFFRRMRPIFGSWDPSQTVRQRQVGPTAVPPTPRVPAHVEEEHAQNMLPGIPIPDAAHAQYIVQTPMIKITRWPSDSHIA